MPDYTEERDKISAMLAASGLPKEQQIEVLFQAIDGLASVAESQHAIGAGSDFLKILLDLLVQFLPILLKLLAG